MPARYYKELLGFCARALNNRDAAADVVQEAYARILLAQRAGMAIADPRALLFRTSRNLMVDQHRRAEVRAHQSLDDLLEDEQPPAPQYLQPEEACAFGQYARAICAAIEALPPRCREAFILNRFDGLSHQQVADAMGISRNMVAQHVVRGVLACKACDDRLHGRTRSARPTSLARPGALP